MNAIKKKLFTNRKLVHERRTQIHVLSFVQVERFYRISFLSFVQGASPKTPWNFSFPGNRILESGDVGIRRVLISTTAFTVRYRHVGHIDINISQDSLATQNLDSKWKRRAPLSPPSLDTVIQHLLSRNMPAPLDVTRSIV